MIFVLLSIPVILISWRTLFNIKNHGFYRFFSWECIILLFAFNYKYWFHNPLSTRQIVSWILLIISVYLVTAGVVLLKKRGKPQTDVREDKALYSFEKTSELVDTGLYKYIRHPLYSSLFFLTWGIFLKNITLFLFIISLLSSLFLYLTAVNDEKECIKTFGDRYSDYMKRSKRFIPYVF